MYKYAFIAFSIKVRLHWLILQEKTLWILHMHSCIRCYNMGTMEQRPQSISSFAIPWTLLSKPIKTFRGQS